ncbi:uncharacterized protein VTP21DRAFT_8812 [Calcarisporiella thermophila]|uniref:uncharacterized protein n=1 Tax=Calcarisporiella thermophila TaxID=911321 RepID=UPI00374324D3
MTARNPTRIFNIEIETGKRYAVKVINKKLMAGRSHMIRNEINVLKQVSEGHHNILKMVDYFETESNMYLVMELALGGELFDRIVRRQYYCEKDAIWVVREVCEAIAYLHDNGIVHRDLKPENLLFRTPADDSELLLADFGFSRILDTDCLETLKTVCGTPGYMAPEIIKKIGYSTPVDMWSLGVITYFLLSGSIPFERESNIEELQAVLTCDYTFDPETWDEISAHAKDFIDNLLVLDPTRRMTPRQALQHPWIVDTHRPEIERDLLPKIRKNFNARRTFKKAVDAVQMALKLRQLSQHSVEVDALKPEEEDVQRVGILAKEDNTEKATKAANLLPLDGPCAAGPAGASALPEFRLTQAASSLSFGGGPPD